MFYIVQPDSTRRDRYRHATLVSEHATADQAFAELERLTTRLLDFQIPADAPSTSSPWTSSVTWSRAVTDDTARRRLEHRDASAASDPGA